MADSLLSTLFGTLDKRGVTGIADSLGVSEQSATQGLKSGIATLLGGIASKSEDPNSLRALLELAPKTQVDNPLLQVARGITGSNLSWLTTGRNLLSSLFGDSEAAVANAVGSASGLRGSAASTLLASVAPLVMSFIANHARMEGMNMRSLGNFLQRESSTIKSALPAGVEQLLWPVAQTASPVVAQSVEREASSFHWLPLVVLAALIPGIVWLFSHRHVTVPAVNVIVPTVPRPSVREPVGTANRVVQDPVESVRLALQNTELYFDTGSAKLRPDSQARLDQIASTLSANPDVHMTINGHTDNIGSADQNMRLSRERANNVMAQLIRKGIPADRLSISAHGQQDPATDNSTEDNRAENRRVSFDFSQH